MNESEAKLLRAQEVVLDKTPVFHHEIQLFDKDKFLIEKIKLEPNVSDDIYWEIIRLWNRLRKENRDATISTSAGSSK